MTLNAVLNMRLPKTMYNKLKKRSNGRKMAILARQYIEEGLKRDGRRTTNKKFQKH